MARDFKRTDRIGEQMQKELAMILQREIKDPRLGMITINAVKVSKDLSYADMYFTVLNLDPAQSAELRESALYALEQARGFLRSELSHRIKLRVMPQLRFHYDTVIENAMRMDGLIREARAKDHSGENE
ncbi:MAG: 30S ribosome-binding factor RbfA [Hahellaceae bacterium]|nr:30S ribosome-binding factor RbfA [Hahellaceae bacterium]